MSLPLQKVKEIIDKHSELEKELSSSKDGFALKEYLNQFKQ